MLYSVAPEEPPSENNVPSPVARLQFYKVNSGSVSVTCVQNTKVIHTKDSIHRAVFKFFNRLEFNLQLAQLKVWKFFLLLFYWTYHTPGLKVLMSPEENLNDQHFQDGMHPLKDLVCQYLVQI